MKAAAATLAMILGSFFAKSEFWTYHPQVPNADARTAGTFVGQIMDSKCATTGSHDANLKSLVAKDARDCTLRCAKDGSFVLDDPDTKTVYQLNDQEKPVRFAGQNVTVSGTCEKESKTIVVASIEARNPESPR